jgi:phosphomannomutase/phosphoglucomutase
MNKNIFRAYDIRGVYPIEINETVAELIGKAYGTLLFNKNNALGTVVIARDNRETSPKISYFFQKGLLSTGHSIVDVGMAMTPMLYYYSCLPGYSGGVMITASHNPSNYNGIKLVWDNAVPLHANEIQELHAIIENQSYISNSPGSVRIKNLFLKYLSFLKSTFNYKNPKQLVVNCGNGVSSYFAPKIFKALGFEILPQRCVSYGDFPYGIPNPEDLNYMESIRDYVLETKSDLGIGFDADGDRLGIVDSKGFIPRADKLLILLAENELQKNPKDKKIYFDVKCTDLLFQKIKEFGGVPIMIPTGHSYLTDAVQKDGLMGAELSGHFYYKGDDYYGFDDAIFTACKLLTYLDDDKLLADQLRELPLTANSSEIKLHVSDELKFNIIDSVIKKADQLQEVEQISKIDGVRVSIKDMGWFLVRASNTSPSIIVRVESFDDQKARALLKIVGDILKDFEGLDLSLLDSAKISYC